MKPMLLLVSFFFLACFRAPAASINPPSLYEAQPAVFSMKPAKFTRLTGVRLSIEQKIAWSVLRKKFRKQQHATEDGPVRDKGKTAVILGIIALGGLLIPVVNLFSIPLAIMAIVLGNKAKKLDPSDRKARHGVFLGILTIALLAIIGLTVAIVLTVSSVPR